MDKKPKKSVLDRFKLYHERGDHDIGYVSPTAGKPKPWYDGLFGRVMTHIKNFFVDIKNAIKEIINKIM